MAKRTLATSNTSSSPKKSKSEQPVKKMERMTRVSRRSTRTSTTSHPAKNPWSQTKGSRLSPRSQWYQKNRWIQSTSFRLTWSPKRVRAQSRVEATVAAHYRNCRIHRLGSQLKKQMRRHYRRRTIFSHRIVNEINLMGIFVEEKLWLLTFDQIKE